MRMKAAIESPLRKGFGPAMALDGLSVHGAAA